MAVSYPDKKEIFLNDKWQTKFLWKDGTGIRVQIGQYYCNLVLPSAMTRSVYIKNVICDWLNGDISKLKDRQLYTNKITNIKAFTLFWNWLNGACDYIPPFITKDADGIDVVDMIDIIEYISFFNSSYLTFPIIEHYIENLSIYISDIIYSDEYDHDKTKIIYNSKKRILDFYNSCISNIEAGNSSMIDSYKIFSDIGICINECPYEGACKSAVDDKGGNYRYCKEHKDFDLMDTSKDDSKESLDTDISL